jgi:hypothetical protein
MVRSPLARGIHDKYIDTSSTTYTQTTTQAGRGAYTQGAYMIITSILRALHKHRHTHTPWLRSLYARGIRNKVIDNSNSKYPQTHTGVG